MVLAQLNELMKHVLWDDTYHVFKLWNKDGTITRISIKAISATKVH